MSYASHGLRRSALFGYGLAVASVGTAVVLARVFQHFDSPLPLTGFELTAIAITFWCSSVKPGIFAVLLATLVRSFFFEASIAAVPGMLYDSVFLLFALPMIWMTRERNILEEEVAERTAELARANEDLKLEIAERKRNEDHLRLVLDTTPAMIHSARPDGYLDYFNQGWLNYVGRTLQDLQGWGWTTTFHLEDVKRIVGKWRTAIASGEPFQAEARVRRADGEYRWMLLRKVPLRDEHGNIVKWYGSATDIEDLKRAEKELRRLSGRLLNLQDDERRRIARDLHDSTGQNLVALATMLGQLNGLIPAGEPRSRPLLSDSRTLAEKCIREVRTLSYSLHPPELDEGGLEDAIRDYARGFTNRTGIHLELDLSPRLGRIARDIEVTLFRVVQEALTNVQRHSGSHQAKIRINRNSHLIMEVSDPGRGVPAGVQEEAQESRFEFGLGIPSMRERVKLIEGQLDITSTSQGTIVRVTVPLGGKEHEKASHSHS